MLYEPSQGRKCGREYPGRRSQNSQHWIDVPRTAGQAGIAQSSYPRQRISPGKPHFLSLLKWWEHVTSYCMRSFLFPLLNGSAKGLVRFEDGRFWMELLYALAREVAECRLHGYFERRG
jgi:hypothetical protein